MTDWKGIIWTEFDETLGRIAKIGLLIFGFAMGICIIVTMVMMMMGVGVFAW